MTKTIAINGHVVTVLNRLSSGPGAEPHTYELRGGSYVYEIAGRWWLQERGQYPRLVTVTFESCKAVGA